MNMKSVSPVIALNARWKWNGENAATLFVDVIDDAVDPPLVLEAIGIRHRS
jgi:hypothetical protein